MRVSMTTEATQEEEAADAELKKNPTRRCGEICLGDGMASAGPYPGGQVDAGHESIHAHVEGCLKMFLEQF